MFSRKVSKRVCSYFRITFIRHPNTGSCKLSGLAAADADVSFAASYDQGATGVQ